MPESSLGNLSATVLAVRVGQASGRLAALREEDAGLREKVARAKARVALQPKLNEVMDALTARVLGRSVGAFEALLSALSHDVLDAENARDIKLQLSSKAGTASLDVLAVNDGNLEDVYQGNGGALTNVVSTGLRYCALVRSGLNRFLVLDEPDCWISTDAIGRFFKVVAEAAQAAKVQTLIITHHPLSQMPPGVSYAYLDKAGSLESTVVTRPSGTQLARVELENFGPHTYLKLPLGGGVTVLSGAINQGKSWIPRAIEALAMGSSTDTQIRHGADFAVVTVSLADGTAVRMTRKRKGAPKTRYEHFLGDVPVRVEDGERGRALDWVSDVLGIGLADTTMNVQLVGQKNPVFLLGPDVTGSQRARVLSVGRESQHLDAMREIAKKWARTDRETISSGEARIELMTHIFLGVRGLDALPGVLAQIAKTEAQIREKTASADRLQSLVRALSRCERILSLGERLASANKSVFLPEAPTRASRIAKIVSRAQRIADFVTAAGALPKLPEISDVSLVMLKRLEASVRGLRVSHKVASLALVACPALPAADGLDKLKRLVSTTKRLAHQQQVSGVAVPRLPGMPDTREHIGTASRLNLQIRAIASAVARVAEANVQLRNAAADEAAAKVALGEFQNKLGSVCPLCAAPLVPGEHHDQC